jgi:hypothetical protein
MPLMLRRRDGGAELKYFESTEINTGFNAAFCLFFELDFQSLLQGHVPIFHAISDSNCLLNDQTNFEVICLNRHKARILGRILLTHIQAKIA